MYELWINEWLFLMYFEKLTRCNSCGRLTTGVYIHGHTQCSWCKVNIEPCCQGQENIHAVCKRDNPQQGTEGRKVN